MFEVTDLCVEAEGTEILDGIDFSVDEGEVHAIMGPNGSGKSTLAKVAVGHPDYEVTGGDIVYRGESLLDEEPEERAEAGIFMAFQYPVEIPGVKTSTLLREACNNVREARGEDPLDPLQFDDYVRDKLELVDMDPDLLDRSVNVDFSGGEKKRAEILQMAVLEPSLAFLDETDSGLDIDALRTVSEAVNGLSNDDNAFVLITHYQRVLDYIEPDRVHVMVDGKLAKSGGPELAVEVEDRGYDWVEREAGLEGEGVA
ncbi:MAG: Fe-S cluster assembly ATPase SufC [Bradymonadaceae bacterium]